MGGNFGYGHMSPYRSNDLFNKLDFIIEQKIAKLNTMKLVQVAAVAGGGVAPAGTVDVLPLVNQIDGNRNATSHGIVPGLPWSRVQGGKNAIICDPAVGDIGYVVAADRDISSVKATLKRSSPGSFRQFDIADGVYAGGCLNLTPTQYVVFTATGIRIVDANGNVVTMGADGITLVDLNGNQIQMKAGSVNIVTPSFTVNGTVVVVP